MSKYFDFTVRVVGAAQQASTRRGTARFEALRNQGNAWLSTLYRVGAILRTGFSCETFFSCIYQIFLDSHFLIKINETCNQFYLKIEL